ncbi:MAG: PAS domain-containing protein, partial [Methanoregula sp.]
MKEKDCILVVDDDEGTRKSLTLLLKRKGFETEHAGTGKEALEITQGRPVNLTLLDIKLPDIEGIQLLAPLKKTNPDMSIIMITGFASVESAVRALNAGASGYITKPIDLDEMLTRIKNALDYQHLVNEIRQAEKKIESLAKFPEENPNPIFRVTNDGVLIFANKSAELILNELGLSVGTKVQEFLEKILNEAIDSGSQLELEKTVGEKTYLFTIAPIIGQNYVNIYGLDITERKKAEQRLIENELKFRELFDNMSSGVALYEANEDGNDFFFKNLNRAGERIDGLKRQDVIGKSLFEIFPAIKEFGLFDVLQRVWRTGVPESQPASLYKDARITGWRTNFIYKLPSGEIAAIYDDITERKDAEEALRKSEEKFRGIFNKINDAIHLHDIGKDGSPGNFIDVNDIACQMLQYSRDEMMQYNPLDFVTEYHSRPIDKILEELVTVGKVEFETEHTRKDGTIVPVEINAHIITLMGKKVVLSVVRDITERKKTDEQIRNSLVQIENDLVQMALFNDQIRNPLAVIIALLDSEQESKTNTKICEQVYKIDELITTLDRQYMNSEKVREFLKKHY